MYLLLAKLYHRQKNLFNELVAQSTVELLLFEEATFSDPLLFKDPYYFKAVIIFARATFSKDVV